jgi:hypothetical protein
MYSVCEDTDGDDGGSDEKENIIHEKLRKKTLRT